VETTSASAAASCALSLADAFSQQTPDQGGRDLCSYRGELDELHGRVATGLARALDDGGGGPVSEK
jgi:hypothetical protein